MLPNAEYATLDKVAMAAEAEENPSRFLGRFPRQVILDEIQYAPSLLRELKVLIDANRTDYGRWILTGSQRMSLMQGISESLAGRIGILQLETLSAKELRGSGRFSIDEVDASLWKGGFPECWANPAMDIGMYFDDYIQTYLERDLKTLVNVSNLRDFQRFIQICATRAGQLLNMADMAKQVGVAAGTIKSWLGALEASGIIHLLPPYFANIGKRLAKSPKLYFADNGLLCRLLHVGDGKALESSLHVGNIWENMVLTELIKTTNAKPGRNLFYYRDQNTVEIDFVVESAASLFLIEAKSSEQVDSRKLNFRKVAPLFANQDVRCILLCANQDKDPIRLKDHDIANPLRHDLCGILET